MPLEAPVTNASPAIVPPSCVLISWDANLKNVDGNFRE
jgi:hypothetical protein